MGQTRIFVVEDEQIVSKDIQMRLKRFGYDIAGATASGEEAILLIQKTTPDLVLMDIMLKGEMMGTQAAEVIYKKYDIPVVYLTANADQNTLNQAKVTEPYGYVLKPFDERELQTAIEMALYKHQSEREKQKLKEQLLQAQKLEAIGHLTTGVAHNFNNALNVVMGNLELARYKANDETQPYLERAQKASEGATRIVDGLLAFCRKKEMKRERVNMCAVVQKVTNMFRESLKGEIDLQTHMPDTALIIEGDDNQLPQVILNMYLNAQDALEDIETQNHQPQITVEIQELKQDEQFYVCISIADNGIGMNETVKQHIFAPFYTTKPVDRGTGLGLATAYGIIKDHNGWIDCTSEEKMGTKFDIYIPLAKGSTIKTEKKNPFDNAKDARTDDKGHTDTILVIEDEDLVRHTTTELLKLKGYQIIEAVDGQDGWETFLREKDQIDLVLMDLSMPKISGLEVLKKMMDHDPTTRVIIATGNPPDEVLAPQAKAVLAKPLLPSVMFKTVQDILAR